MMYIFSTLIATSGPCSPITCIYIKNIENVYLVLPPELLDYVYTTPERNNAGRIYERLHYTVVVF